MYEAFYGLRERPFNLTPDPKFLYLSEKHKEAFAHLLYGIKNRSGFVMLSGEIGTGKTTICRNLLNQLESDTKVAFIFNPALNPIELMKKINQEFGVDESHNTLLELVDNLNRYLLESAPKGVNNVLVIDESQNLEPEVLEQIRLLSNLETETEKLLQIILIGQPELAEKLSLHRLRQLNQRITARYHLHELDETETMQYIAYRLHVAGGRRKVRFAKGSVNKIHKISGGTPRVINALCDRCLLIGYTKETHTITPAIVKQAAKEIKGERVESMGDKRGFFAKLSPWMPSPSVALTAVVVVLALQLYIQPFQQQLSLLNENMQETVGTKLTKNTVGAPADPTAEDDKSSVQAPSTKPNTTTKKSGNSFERYKHTSLMVEAARKPDNISKGSALTALDAESARKSAATALLRAWNLAPVNGLPNDDTEASLIDFAKRSGLDAEPLTPTLQQLRNINLPAFVQMEVEGKTIWTSLVGSNADEVSLSGGMGETLDLSAEEFEAAYTKHAILLWQDPNPANKVMLLGQDTPDIGEFKKQLRGLGRISAENTSTRYDEETATAVAQIQSEAGLWVDSKAGKQVRMVLMSWLPESSTPKLGVRENADAPVRHVSVRRPEATGSAVSAQEITGAVDTIPAPITPLPDLSPQEILTTPALASSTPFDSKPKRVPAPSPYAPKVEQAEEMTPLPGLAPKEPAGVKLNELESVDISLPLDASVSATPE